MPENFDVLLPKFFEIKVGSLATLKSIADILVEKAVFDSVFCELFASLLVKINAGLPSFTDDIATCVWKNEDSVADVDLVRLVCRRCFSSCKDGSALPPIDPELLADEVWEERTRKLRRKELSVYVLIGELYKIAILSPICLICSINCPLVLNESIYDTQHWLCLLLTCCKCSQ